MSERPTSERPRAGYPGEQRASRHAGWVYVAGGLVAVLAVALAVVAVARGGDSGSSRAESPTTSPASTTPASTAATGSTAPTSTAPAPTTVSLPAIADDTQSYAKYLFAAWQNGDTQAAARVASADAVKQMFSQPYSSRTPYVFGRCDPAAGSVYCTFIAAGGTTITMTVRNITGGLPIQVVAVQRS